ncbi:VOC family protein [Bacillus sp. JCM 19041]
MSMQPIKGFHHISAYTADANRNAAFYLNVLGFRLVKKRLIKMPR